MVAKINKGSSLFGVLAYNLKKIDNGHGKILFSNRVLNESNGKPSMQLMQKSFETYLNRDHGIAKPIVHISLNPHPKDKLNDEQLTDIARQYMEELGYGNQPFMVVKHSDIEREHVHIVTLRIDGQGKAISDSFEHLRSQEITRKLEMQYGLHKADQQKRMESSIKKIDPKKGDIKNQLSNTLNEILKTYKFLSFNEFRTLISLYNIEVEEVKGMRNGEKYTGLVYYATDKKGKKASQPFKSSAIGKSVGYHAIQKCIKKSEHHYKNSKIKGELKSILTDALHKSSSQKQFIRKLKKSNIEVVFRQNKKGRIYGVTFVDHISKIILNGSRIDKQLSANFFESHFNPVSLDIKKHSPLSPEKEKPVFKHEDDFSSGASGLWDILPDPNPFIPYEDEWLFKLRKRKKKKRKIS